MNARESWADALSREELKELTTMQDWRSWFSLTLNWGLIFASFALVALVPHVLTIVLAIFLIGGRQLGLAVLMHEASHRSLFRSKKVNDWVGNWLCAYPTWSDMKPYRRYHLQHHSHTWTQKDPDLDLASPFPVTRDSLRRKIWRDLSGQTGWKRARAIVRRDLGGNIGKTFRGDNAGWQTLIPVTVTNAVLLGILALAGRPELYLLWVIAWFTTYSLVMRIRAIGEHSMPRDSDDEFYKSRTTNAGWLARIFLAPNRVNYHLEHHLHMSVPHYHLPRMRRLLQERGVLEQVPAMPGYIELLRQASSKAA